MNGHSRSCPESAELEKATAALVALAEHGIPADVQELLVYGNPGRGIAPGAFSKAVRAVLLTGGVAQQTACPESMKARPNGFLRDELISHTSEQFDYIRELHEYLWRFVRVANPGASGRLEAYVPEAIALLEGRSSGVAQKVPDCGDVPEREAFWLLERHDGKAWALYTSHSGAFVHSYTEDVWQAGRFLTQRHAHDVWRSLEKSERERWKPVEHMFINKVQDTSALPSTDGK